MHKPAGPCHPIKMEIVRLSISAFWSRDQGWAWVGALWEGEYALYTTLLSPNKGKDQSNVANRSNISKWPTLLFSGPPVSNDLVFCPIAMITHLLWLVDEDWINIGPIKQVPGSFWFYVHFAVLFLPLRSTYKWYSRMWAWEYALAL